MRCCLMLGMVPSMFGRLDLGQPADQQNTNNEKDGEEFTRYAVHFQIPSTLAITTASEHHPLQQSTTDATDATSRAEW